MKQLPSVLLQRINPTIPNTKVVQQVVPKRRLEAFAVRTDLAFVHTVRHIVPFWVFDHFLREDAVHHKSADENSRQFSTINHGFLCEQTNAGTW